MILKITSTPQPLSSKFYSKPSAQQPVFCACPFKSASAKRSGGVLSYLKKLAMTFDNLISKINPPKEESRVEIARNNKFIERIQKKFSNIRFFSGDYGTKYGAIIRVTDLPQKQRLLEMISKEDESLIRSAVIDKNNTILLYKSAYPWKVFAKTDDGYRSDVNIDAFMRYYATSPEFEMCKIPKF